jgi:hypothetical protein
MADIPTIDDLLRLLETTKNEIISAFEEKLQKNDYNMNSEWLRTFQVKKMLNVSDATLHNYRIDGLLPSRKIRGTHFYLKADVLKLMSNDK